jgi:hypothetical protein
MTALLGRLDCRGYGVVLTPWRCIENQLSLFCLPGWPCECCEKAVTIQIPARPPSLKGEGAKMAQVGDGLHNPPRAGSSFPDPGGATSLKKTKTRRKKSFYDPKTMTRAVARDLGLI